MAAGAARPGGCGEEDERLTSKAGPRHVEGWTSTRRRLDLDGFGGLVGLGPLTRASSPRGRLRKRMAIRVDFAAARKGGGRIKKNGAHHLWGGCVSV